MVCDNCIRIANGLAIQMFIKFLKIPFVPIDEFILEDC